MFDTKTVPDPALLAAVVQPLLGNDADTLKLRGRTSAEVAS